jgi:predicted N-acetyltransferase YhbS
MTDVKIRKAIPTDLQGIYDLLSDMYNEFHYEYAPGEPLVLMNWVNDVLSLGHTFVAVKDDLIVGSIGLRATTFPWNNSFFYFTDDWIFVRPEHRQGGTTNELVGHVLRYAEQLNPEGDTVPIQLAVTFGDKPEIKDRYFRQKGLTYIGGIFMNGFQKR